MQSLGATALKPFCLVLDCLLKLLVCEERPWFGCSFLSSYLLLLSSQSAFPESSVHSWGSPGAGQSLLGHGKAALGCRLSECLLPGASTLDGPQKCGLPYAHLPSHGCGN